MFYDLPIEFQILEWSLIQMREVEAKEECYIPEQNVVLEYLSLLVEFTGGCDTICKLVKVF